jgi:BASS family bile acid:Na+ symporter
MSLAALIVLVLKASIAALIFALGLKTPISDLTMLLREPALLARSILAMNLLMPAVAAMLVLFCDLRPPLGGLLVALSLAPVPPMLPRRFARAGGEQSYGVSLLVAAALVSVVSIPVSVEVVERIFGIPLSITPADVMGLLALSLAAPLVAGLALHRLAPGLSEGLVRPLSLAADALLLLALAGLLAASWKAMAGQLSVTTLSVMAIFVAAGLAIGHVLGGPDPQERTVLALATAARHPGVAAGVVRLAAPEAKGVLPLLLIYLLASAILSMPYAAWRKRKGALPL